MKKSFSNTVKKNPYLSMLTLGMVAVPLGIDTNILPDYHMIGSLVTDAAETIPAIVLTSFFYKWNKNRGTEVKIVEPKTLGEKLQSENSQSIVTKEFKPSIAINSFIMVGAIALGHALSHSFYNDIRIYNYPINLHMVNLLSPKILLSSIVMFGATNLVVAAKQKLQEIRSGFVTNKENNSEKTVVNQVDELKEKMDKLNMIKSGIAEMREVEKEQSRFKPLT